MFEEDTIVALATPPGRGAVCLVRVSGPDAVKVVDQCWRGRHPLAEAPVRMALRGTVVDAGGNAIDEVLATRFAHPASYTGEDVVEVSGHGGSLVARLLIDAFLAAGARVAEPGEFTQRAFLNGKMDLAEAEAVMDMISAQTALALRAAHAQLVGGLGERLDDLREGMIGVLAHVEAYIDFPDEDIAPETGEDLCRRLRSLLAGVDALLATAERGRMLREGARLVIAGQPNAGKSSLLNVLLGFDRAIVSEEAGTTRDTVEEVIDLGGLLVRLIDTAGLRTAAGEVESLGVERTTQALATADIVLEVIDATHAPKQVERIRVPDGVGHHLVVLNKTDLGPHPGWEKTSRETVALSCQSRDGVDGLVERLQSCLDADPSLPESGLLAINARHQDCLRRARKDLVASEAALAGGQLVELVAEDLRAALSAIGEISGNVDPEEILGAIFGSFCVGK